MYTEISGELPAEFLRQLAAQIRKIRDGLAEIEGTAESPDGLILATVSGCGELIGLDLNPRIYRTTDSQALETAILDTVDAARRSAEAEVAGLAAELLPHGELAAGPPIGHRVPV
ncbi:YbaB/EbfC family nucleoid-associated protein [Amycolatopsis sp. H20-H5]|uniref:YbaB/EbfC family nucleoid-associated protein n=1 Tax=Amycolatopsis sp. H20-H5 TaxID=3046309 RepID=UPI002DBAF17C|nr:YbaB/EbfC family nucleoid-associated protein [Amycolatopsis sp. H20-H5]MEC3981817.1 YbaB/EbfC family nucleoid-associated protein [Amycolatopsis sp. H20-H5]